MSRQSRVGLRPALPDDEDFLWEMLYYASHSNDEPGVGPNDIRANRGLTRYVHGWGKNGDLGVIAESIGTPCGAAWVRLLTESERSDVAWVDSSTPELAVAVLPGFEGLGIGTAMMDELIGKARGAYPAIVLTVRADNPAVRLYQRLGFGEVARVVNRVGTESVKMLLDLGVVTP